MPVGLHWTFADMEPVWQAAEIGNLDPVARVVEAMRSEGILAGSMKVRCAFIRKPITFQGDPWLCDMLRGEAPTFDKAGRMVRPGRKGLFRRMHPTAALLDLTYTAILGGQACAEYVDDPLTGLPVLHARDLHRLRFDWGERCWKYRGEKGEYLVTPGDGRWIFFCPDATHRPWRSGSWLPLMLAFIVMISTTYDAARFQGKSADPLKAIEVPDEVPPEEVDRLEDFVQNWWERAPGIVLRYGAKASLVETNGIGHQIYTHQREWAASQILFTLRGSVGTSGESEGIFGDGEVALDIAESLIQDTADALAECLSEQGLGPWAVRYGYVRNRDDAPTMAWDARSPARRLAEANAAGVVADNVLKINAAVRADGQRVNAPAYLIQCGVTVPLVPLVEVLDAVFEEMAPEAAGPGLLPAASTIDAASAEVTPEGSLE